MLRSTATLRVTATGLYLVEASGTSTSMLGSGGGRGSSSVSWAGFHLRSMCKFKFGSVIRARTGLVLGSTDRSMSRSLSRYGSTARHR